MNTALTLSPFEQEILTVMSMEAHINYSSMLIQVYGKKLYGIHWGGDPRVRKGSFSFGKTTYPKINLTLGRLAQKELVEREEWLAQGACKYTAGMWRLTEEGALLMGISIDELMASDV